MNRPCSSRQSPTAQGNVSSVGTDDEDAEDSGGGGGGGGVGRRTFFATPSMRLLDPAEEAGSLPRTAASDSIIAPTSGASKSVGERRSDGSTREGVALQDDGGERFHSPHVMMSPTSQGDNQQLSPANRERRGVSAIDNGYGEQFQFRSRRSFDAESQLVAAGEEKFARRPPGMLSRQWQPKERSVGSSKAVVSGRDSPDLVGGSDGSEYGVGGGDHFPPPTTVPISSTPLLGRLQQALKKLTAKETTPPPGATTSTSLASSEYVGDRGGGSHGMFAHVSKPDAAIPNSPPEMGSDPATTADGDFYPRSFGGGRVTGVTGGGYAGLQPTTAGGNSPPGIPAWGEAHGPAPIDPVLPPPVSTVPPASPRPISREGPEGESGGRSGSGVSKGKRDGDLPAAAAAKARKVRGRDETLSLHDSEEAVGTLEWPSLLGAIGSKAPQSPSPPQAVERDRSGKGWGLSQPLSPSLATEPISSATTTTTASRHAEDGGGGYHAGGALETSVGAAGASKTSITTSISHSPPSSPRLSSPNRGVVPSALTEQAATMVLPRAVAPRSPPRPRPPPPPTRPKLSVSPARLPGTCRGVGVEVTGRLRDRAWLAGTREWGSAESDDSDARERDRLQRALGRRFDRHAVGALFPLRMVLQVRVGAHVTGSVGPFVGGLSCLALLNLSPSIVDCWSLRNRFYEV